MKNRIPSLNMFALSVWLSGAGLFLAAGTHAAAGEAGRPPDPKPPKLAIDSGLPQLRIDPKGANPPPPPIAAEPAPALRLTGLPQVGQGKPPIAEEMPEPFEMSEPFEMPKGGGGAADEAYRQKSFGSPKASDRAIVTPNAIARPKPKPDQRPAPNAAAVSAPLSDCAGTPGGCGGFADCPGAFSGCAGAMAPLPGEATPDYVSPLPEPEDFVAPLLEGSTSSGPTESGTAVFVGEGEGLTGKMIGDLLDGELLKKEAPAEDENVKLEANQTETPPLLPEMPEPGEKAADKPAAKPENYQRTKDPSELEIEKKGPPADPFGDLPKYVEALVPQSTLAYKSEVLLKLRGEPTFATLEQKKETVEADLLDKYNNWLASAGQIGRVEMVLTKPVRYARDGTWVRAEFNQIVHDIYGRRLPDYETEYYVIVVGL